MSLILYPDPKLHTKCRPVESVNSLVLDAIKHLFRNIDSGKFFSLSAPQINLPWNVFVINKYNNKYTFINPIIEILDGDSQISRETCLSMSGSKVEVIRWNKICVTALDESGRKFKKNFHGELSALVQHEYDHLQGVSMIDDISSSARRIAVWQFWEENFGPKR